MPAIASRREQIVAPFRYDWLDTHKAALARRAEEAIKRTLAANVRKIGAELIKVKSCLDHGEWLAWLEFRCELSERTAQRYIAVARFLNEVQITGPVSDTGLVQLAAPTTPQQVREELVQKINAGTRLTTRAIARRIAEARNSHQARARRRARRGKKPEQGRAPERWDVRIVLSRESRSVLQAQPVGAVLRATITVEKGRLLVGGVQPRASARAKDSW